MELEQFKHSWRVYTKNKEETLKMNRHDLREMLREKSSHSLKKIGKAMSIDAALMLFTSVSFIILSFALDLKGKYMVTSLILGFTLLLFLHYHLNRLGLLKLMYSSGDLKKMIHSVIMKINRLRKMYLFSIPTMGSFLFLAGLFIEFNYSHSTFLFSEFLLYTILCIPLFICLYILTKWVFNSIYYKPLEELLKIKDTLEENN